MIRAMQTTTIDQDQVYTVSRLNNEARFILEDTFPSVWVEGEISNFSAPNSGHWYFSLKDSGAQVSCAMFKGNQRGLGFTPKDGMHVLLKARVSLYENTGRYQLIAEKMEERGEGKLRRAFEALKKKLEAAGLFDIAHKKALPAFPTQIGVITSATGAAIRDILTVLKRRYASVPVIIYPTLVQGDTAAPTIVKAIQTANRRNECNILILARGGGSLEDLWPFNEEIVAKAIFESQIPIISGVGHEVDFTIADFVADKRAPTPSAAAEMVTPNKLDLLNTLSKTERQFIRCMQYKLTQQKQQITWMQKHLQQQHPKRQLLQKAQRLDFCELALVQQQNKLINKLQTKLMELDRQLHRLAPTRKIHTLQNQLKLQHQQFNNLILMQLNMKKTALANAAAKLDALSPLATLSRGYAIATKDQRVIHSSSEIKENDLIQIKLSQGSLDCRVEKVNN